jgi:hypothetical protein
MLTAHVSVSVKEKIWANEFIELNSLLRKHKLACMISVGHIP